MSSPPESPAAYARPRVARSVALLLVAHLATVAVGFATVIGISRLLDEEALGRWRFAQAILTYLIVVADLGLTTLAVREISRNPADAERFAGPVLVVRLVTGVALAAFAIALVHVLAPADASAFYAIAFLAVIPNAVSLIHVVQGHERLRTFAFARLTLTALGGLFGLASLLMTGELIALVVWPLVAGLAVDAWLAWVTLRRLRVGLVLGSPAVWTTLVGAGVPFLVGGIAMQLISNADAVIIGVTRGERQLGTYAVAYLLAGQLLFLSAPIAAAVYPRLSHLHHRGSEFPAALRDLAGVLGLLVIPFCVAAAMLSDEIVRVLYGERFSEASALLATLLGMPAIGFYNVALAQGLNAAGRQGDVMRVSMAAAAVSVGMNVVLVPTIGLMGAALTAVAVEAVTASLYTVAARPLVAFRPLRAYAAPALASAVMALVIFGADRVGLPVPVVVVLAVASYAGAILVRPPEAAVALRRLLSGLGRQRPGSAIL